VLYVTTYLARSEISGIGLFAAEPIEPGTIIWSFVAGLDREYSPATVKRWPRSTQARLRPYMYLSRRSHTYILAMDHSRYINHSSVPNAPDVVLPGSRYFVTIANRLISPREEITSDYSLVDLEFAQYQHTLRDTRPFSHESRSAAGDSLFE
jgi:uncharacterized protein